MRLFSSIQTGRAHERAVPVRAFRLQFIFTREKPDACRARQKREYAARGGVGLAEEGLQEAGRRIGRDYRVIKKLGHGGDGTIYLVQHGPTEQLRAAKLLKTDTPGRRRHELDMMKRLRHPALPQIYDVLEEQGNFWIVMEFIDGKTLSELCEDEKIGPLRFFSVARQLSEALVYLHSRRPPVLHLDIKPSNIMIQADGTLVLIDFGAAVRADARAGRTACFGTPGFAAPEQWDPDIEADVRADFYGFGAVLYFCLYGSVPGFRGKAKRNSISGDRSREKKTSGREDADHDLKRAGWKREAASLTRRCMREDREKRFPDTVSLYRSVRKAEKRYLAWEKMCRSSAAVLFLLAATAFAWTNLRWNDPGAAAAAQIRRSYETLLEQADGLGFGQAVSCYEQAIGLCPEDGVWCDRLLSRIEEDYTFSLEEEGALKKLMFSVPPGRTGTEEELLEDEALEYGELAYRIGIMYWYFYEGSGGRSAAAKWFDRALAWQKGQVAEGKMIAKETEFEGIGTQENVDTLQGDSPAWLASAQIHAKIGSYYGTIGKQSPEGDEEGKIEIYWKDLLKLWQLDSLGRDSPGIRYEVARELLSVLIMQSAELEKEGTGIEQMQDLLSSIELFLNENPEPEKMAEACREQYQAAKEALERLKENERGNELGTEKEE